jgi:hypothetical protein
VSYDAVSKVDLPLGTPSIPRGYKLELDPETGQIFADAPADKRKSRGRVPEEPKRFVLIETPDLQFEWEMLGGFNTLPIRELMIEQGLKSEILFNMRMTAKAPKCSTILRQEYGMTGTPVSLYMQWCRFRKFTPNTKVAEMALAEGELA